MAGTMSQADLVADHKARLGATCGRFTGDSDSDFKRHLDQAALGFSARRPRTLIGEITIVADQDSYATVPADLMAVKFPIWGIQTRARLRPWDRPMEALPRLRLIDTESGRALSIQPPPSAAQITLFGASYRYYYFAAHTIGVQESGTTIHAALREALLVRAGAAAMQELMLSEVSKPVQYHGGLQSVPREATPSALHKTLMEIFEVLVP